MDEFEWGPDWTEDDEPDFASEHEDEGFQMSDVEADADTFASCGWGTDEDYGFFGDESFDDGGW